MTSIRRLEELRARLSSGSVVWVIGISLVLLQSGVLGHFVVGALKQPQVFKFIFYGLVVVIGLVWLVQRSLMGMVGVPVLLSAFFLFCAGSLLWAQSPGSYVNGLVLFGFSLVAASWCASRISSTDLLSILVAAGIVVAVLLIYKIATVDGASYLKDNFRRGLLDGVFRHKNHLGRFAVLLVVVSVFYSVLKKSLYPLILGAFYCLALTLANSAGAIMALGFSVWFLVGTAIVVWRRSWVGGFCVLSTVALTLGIIFSADVLLALGRSPTLTGRVDIWMQVYPFIQESPIWGYGFGGYVEKVKAGSGLAARVSDAHNGYLELLIVVGAAGALLLLLALTRFFSSLSKIPVKESIVLAFFVCFFLFQNIYESLIFKKLDLYWFLLCYAVCRADVLVRRVNNER